MTQKNLIIGIGVLLVLGVAGFIMFMTLRSADSSESGSADFFSTLFPFATSLPGSSSPDSSSGDGPNDLPVATLRQVTNAAVSGGHLTDEGTIVYMERETGHVFTTGLDTNETLRISNTTLPGIERMYWGAENRFVFQYLDDALGIQNFTGKISTSSENQSLSATALQSFERVLFTPDGESIVTVSETPSGSRVSLTELESNRSTTLYTSPIRSWIPLASEKSVYILSAPTSDQPGNLYRLEAGDSLVKVIGNIPGLLALPSPSGRYVLYSSGAGGTIDTAVYDTETKENYRLPLKTLASKCAFLPNNEPSVFCGVPAERPLAAYPDLWFLGVMAFNDRAWVMDPVTGTARGVSDLLVESGGLDVYNPSVSADGAHALFMNKNDLSLWSLQLR